MVKTPMILCWKGQQELYDTVKINAATSRRLSLQRDNTVGRRQSDPQTAVTNQRAGCCLEAVMCSRSFRLQTLAEKSFVLMFNLIRHFVTVTCRGRRTETTTLGRNQSQIVTVETRREMLLFVSFRSLMCLFCVTLLPTPSSFGSDDSTLTSFESFTSKQSHLCRPHRVSSLHQVSGKRSEGKEADGFQGGDYEAAVNQEKQDDRRSHRAELVGGALSEESDSGGEQEEISVAALNVRVEISHISACLK